MKSTTLRCDLCGLAAEQGRPPGWGRYTLHTPDTKCYYLCSATCLREFGEGLEAEELGEVTEAEPDLAPPKGKGRRRTKK